MSAVSCAMFTAFLRPLQAHYPHQALCAFAIDLHPVGRHAQLPGHSPAAIHNIFRSHSFNSPSNIILLAEIVVELYRLSTCEPRADQVPFLH
jgi:hypothetical protein